MTNKLLERFREYINITQFNAIKIGLTSTDKILSLSYGEIKKIETINYRTLKPERDGLFCARIFGPVKDWECNCGKYKRMKHRGITCEKCGVEVIQSRVRRERMGHIALVAPVCHIWYLKGIPSFLSLVLDTAVKDLERVIYFDAYIVINQGKSPYARGKIISNNDYDHYSSNLEDTEFKADSGAEGVKEVLSLINLSDEIIKLNEEYNKSSSVSTRHKLMRRIKVLTLLEQGKMRPEWMILSVLPVLPPDLRPLVPLEGGRFASSDLNELYRRVLNRNIRLQRLIEIKSPSVIIKNEKRMLQEAVDALIDNGRRGQALKGTNKRPLKSLSDMLRGKQGRFRQNLLGKRVDYSGRSVIVVDPKLKIKECGLPKLLALELFKSHVYAGLLEREIAPNLRAARRMVENLDPQVWDVLESIVKNYPVLLNRAPTLHRLGIQSFYPNLVDGKAIKIHPLVCSAYNADFDGDQMAVHLPLSSYAKKECETLVLSTKNILSAANGKPVMVPSQDMVLGIYYITKVRLNAKGQGIVFSSTNEVITAYQHGQVYLHARISVRLKDEGIVETTVGRVILYHTLPEGSKFEWVNKILTKSDISRFLEKIYYNFGDKATVECLDNIKELGFNNSTLAGISIGIDNLVVPEKKDAIIAKTEKKILQVEKLYIDGIITNGERHNKVISLWSQATADVAKHMSDELYEEDQEAYLNKNKNFESFNPIYMMLQSGAKGSKAQIKQLVGMRGLMAKPSGEIIETPVKSNFKHGLNVFEYFISTHGARKGQADTALKTANSGYLTRRLVDVAQDVVITLSDCRTLGYVEADDLIEGGEVLYHVAQRIYGCTIAKDTKDPITGETLLYQGELIKKSDISKIQNSSISEIPVRSVLVCQAKRGVCAKCYGMDLSKGELVDIGTTVGIIAAQSIGEPGTQLTMRTFHIGGTASVTEQSFFAAKEKGIVDLKNTHTVTNKDGQSIILSRKSRLSILSPDGKELQRHTLEYGSILLVKEGQEVKPGVKLAEWDINNKVILNAFAGHVQYVDLIDGITLQDKYNEATKRSTKMVIDIKGDKYQPAVNILNSTGEILGTYYLPSGSYLNVNDGEYIHAGDILVKIPREASKTTDITGGLPRIAELFEARTPKDVAILSDIDGEVVFKGLYKGMKKISVINGAESYDYFIPRSSQLNIINGDKVNAGDKLTSGSPMLQDILRIMGPETLQKYVVNQIQKIYRLQGIDINDRHIQIIVRQMLRKVRIVDPGDTSFLINDKVDRIHFATVNAAITAENKRPATAKPMLMGITLASLGTESFISAASFQETTRILSEAAISGDVDHLYGLKENVIIGRLIPAGTGIKSFRDKYLNMDH